MSRISRELKPLNITDDRPDYEWNGEFTQESLDKGVKASAERRRQANQPQESSSERSVREMDEYDATLPAHRRCQCGHTDLWHQIHVGPCNKLDRKAGQICPCLVFKPQEKEQHCTACGQPPLCERPLPHHRECVCHICLQEKAQPEIDPTEAAPSLEWQLEHMKLVVAALEKQRGIEFQRGQQAMAEKAAQLLPNPDEYFYVEHRGSGNNYRGAEIRFVIDRRGKPVEGKPSYENEDAYEWIKKLVRTIRSLASAEPPQGEAEKGGQQ